MFTLFCLFWEGGSHILTPPHEAMCDPFGKYLDELPHTKSGGERKNNERAAMQVLDLRIPSFPI